MSESQKYRVLIIVSHPVPYIIPQFRLMAQHPKLEILVAYCSLEGAQSYVDPEFGTEVSWEDLPILEGYPWVCVPNNSPKPGLGRFWGLMNGQLWEMIQRSRVDVVSVYAGYAYASFWIAAVAAKLRGIGFIFVTDASSIASRARKTWKSWLKPLLLPAIFRLGDAILVSSRLGQEVVCSLGMPKERVVVTPSSVDNEWWEAQAAKTDPKRFRSGLGIPETASVLLFCAKLQSWKRPQDALQGFAKANLPDAYLLFAGDGEMRGELEAEAEKLQVRDRVKFLGFLSQSQLPEAYRSADLFILPSEYEPFGVVVNEAMLCGCPVLASDRVGAREELIWEGETGFIYPCGDIDAIAQILQSILPNRDRLYKMGQAAKERMKTWSPQENIEAQIHAIELSYHRRQQSH
ncbi:glycosyltransferase [Lusitaniella coriacea LEGE 07157]|uniref:Glycosyltransferase n=1 Tax=Lusitaniella coriacea LEGE 07157 TaxID=945747 RepID=A0A8J7B700_9CYAN|nr:glycosyltransferase [Lusitaniella coriacea]MBE9114781.1 glycosyltransferase [Lusitaniella coriacea LEGE 07157]